VADRTAWLVFEFELFRHGPREWMLLTGDRRLVSLLWLVVPGVGFALLTRSGLVPLWKETPVLFLLFALIAANFTLIAIVASLGQFVLGRRLESPGEIRRDIDDTIAYREAVGETIGRDVLPIRRDSFLRLLYGHVLEELEHLEDASTEGRTKRARVELDDLASGLRIHAEYVIGLLDRPSSGTKHALFTSLSTGYENSVYRTWYLQAEHSGEFTDQAAVPLARLAETLEHIVVASRMFKTVFIESEVSELARVLLYVGLPVQLAAVGAMLLYTAPGTGPPVSSAALSVLVPAVLTAGFAPFLVLASYVVRLTVVARRTADHFPFSSQLDRPVPMREDSRTGDS